MLKNNRLNFKLGSQQKCLHTGLKKYNVFIAVVIVLRVYHLVSEVKEKCTSGFNVNKPINNIL